VISTVCLRSLDRSIILTSNIEKDSSGFFESESMVPLGLMTSDETAESTEPRGLRGHLTSLGLRLWPRVISLSLCKLTWLSWVPRGYDASFFPDSGSSISSSIGTSLNFMRSLEMSGSLSLSVEYSIWFTSSITTSDRLNATVWGVVGDTMLFYNESVGF
jgi:hypothetical protein